MKKENFCREYISKISRARIDGYKQSPGEDDLISIAKYLWNIDLSSALHPSIESFEVCFRNAVYESIKRHQNNHQWLVDASLIQHDDNDLEWKSIQKEIENVKKERERKWRRHEEWPTIRICPVNMDDLIPKLTLGFWHGLFRGKYATTISPMCLERGGMLYPLKPIFVNHQGLQANVRPILELRNRISHHEPVCLNAGSLSAVHSEMNRYTKLIGNVNDDVRAEFDTFDEIVRRGWGYYKRKIEQEIIG